jgi:hypothetical protein
MVVGFIYSGSVSRVGFMVSSCWTAFLQLQCQYISWHGVRLINGVESCHPGSCRCTCGVSTSPVLRLAGTLGNGFSPTFLNAVLYQLVCERRPGWRDCWHIHCMLRCTAAVEQMQLPLAGVQAV